MKTIKILLIATIIIFINKNAKSQDITNPWIQSQIASYGTTIEFININTGFTGVYKDGGHKILKTTDAGNSWSPIWNYSYYSRYLQIHAIDNNNVVVYYGNQNEIQYTTNGGNNWYDANIPGLPDNRTGANTNIMRFLNSSIGYFTYSIENDPDTYPILYFYKTINGGKNWTLCYQKQGNHFANFKYEVNDITFINNNSEYVYCVGKVTSLINSNDINTLRIITQNGFQSANPHQGVTIYNSNSFSFQNIVTLPQTTSETRMLYVAGMSNGSQTAGTYCIINEDYENPRKICDYSNSANVSGLCFNSDNTGYAYINAGIYKTTNSGVNWTLVYNQMPVQYYYHHCIKSFGDVIYGIGYSGTFVTKTLPVSIFTNMDMSNLNYNGSIYVNNVQTNTPFMSNLRGGNYNFYAPKNIENEQKLFYKWENDNSFIPNYSITMLYDNTWV